jgi:hypothetical protein
MFRKNKGYLPPSLFTILVYHELSSAGKVLQLEYLLFVVVDDYLVDQARLPP